jgi:hypothetical protein
LTTQGLFFSLLTTWSITWFTVMYEYGRAALIGWRLQGGTLQASFRGLVKFFEWYFERLGSDVISMFQRGRPEMPTIDLKYEKGHYLRLFIGMSAFTSGLMGALSSTADRSSWPLWLRLMILGALLVSIVAAFGHLYVAWSHTQRRWRLYVLAFFVWIPFGAMIYPVL